MPRKSVLPALVIAIFLSACAVRTSSPPPAPVTATSTPVSAIPAMPSPSVTFTLVPSVALLPSPPPLPLLASPVLGKIIFQDENEGWGIAVNNHGYILRTIDGGKTWLNATPTGAGAIGHSANLFVLNTNTAWVLVPSADFFAGRLYRTSDGGVTWESSMVPFGNGFLQFLDTHTGRFLADRGARGGSEAVTLFGTSDGGASWVSLFHNDPTQPGASDSLPMAGIKNGMTFLNDRTGWVTGSLPEDGEIYVYITQDGGTSWSQQNLNLPTGYEAHQYLPEAPVFFGKEGFLPLVIAMPSQTVLTFFLSQDGGLSWNGDPSEADKVIKPGRLAFGDAQHIWCWDGGTHLSLTTDEAQTWQETATTLDLSGQLNQLQFVPASAGRFTGWALTFLDENGRSRLYHSTDGSTWTPLIP